MRALAAPSYGLRRRIENYMQKSLFVRIVICLFTCGFAFYSYLDKQNDLTSLRIAIPTKMKSLKAIQEENMRLHYEIDQFENPGHLMQLARSGEFAHLKQPLATEVITLREEFIAQQTKEEETSVSFKLSPSLAVGTSP
jgi:hypothetical protein